MNNQFTQNIVNDLNTLRQCFPNGVSSSFGNQTITLSPNYFDLKDNKLCQRQSFCIETISSEGSLNSELEQKYQQQLSSAPDMNKVIPKQALIAIHEHLSSHYYSNHQSESDYKYPYLVELRSDISKILLPFGQHFVNIGSNHTNKTHTFYCTLHSPKKSQKTESTTKKQYKSAGQNFKCEAFIRITQKPSSNDIFQFELSDFLIYHSHTSLDTANFRTMATQSQKELIQNSVNEKPGDVRLKLYPQISLTTAQMSHQRQLGKIKQQKITIDDLYGLFVTTYQNGENNFYDTFFVNPNIKDSLISNNNFAIIDATVGVNSQQFPLEVISISSSSYKSLIAAAMIMHDETKESYVRMFQNFKTYFPEISIFIGDRSQSQISAFEQIYGNEGKYFYCRRHLLSSIKQNANNFYDLFVDFLCNHKFGSQEFEKLVEQKKNIEKEYKYVKDLMIKKEHWYPYYYILAGIPDSTTNTAEGGFGILKQNFSFPQNINTLLKTISLRGVSQINGFIGHNQIPSLLLTECRKYICSHFPILQPLIQELGERCIDYYLFLISCMTDAPVVINGQIYDFSHVHDNYIFYKNICPYCLQKESLKENNSIFIPYPPCPHELLSSQTINIDSFASIYRIVEISGDTTFHEEFIQELVNTEECMNKNEFLNVLGSISQSVDKNPQESIKIIKMIQKSQKGRPLINSRDHVHNQISKDKQRSTPRPPKKEVQYPNQK